MNPNPVLPTSSSLAPQDEVSEDSVYTQVHESRVTAGHVEVPTSALERPTILSDSTLEPSTAPPGSEVGASAPIPIVFDAVAGFSEAVRKVVDELLLALPVGPPCLFHARFRGSPCLLVV